MSQPPDPGSSEPQGGRGKGGKQLLPQRQYNCFSTQPPSPSPEPEPVVVGPYMSNFELFYYLITCNCYLFIVYCYCLLFITATPLRRLRHAVTRAPLSRSLRGGPGRLGTGPGSTRQSKLTIMHPCIHARTNWLVRQWALLHGPARRASLSTGWPGIGPGQGNRARKCSKRRLR